MAEKFEAFWQMYPRRWGDNPKKPARTKWDGLIKDGINPDKIIEAAEVYRQKMQAERKVDTKYVAQAVTWLNQHRFEDHAPESMPANVGDRLGDYVWTGSRWKPIDG